MNTDKFWFGFFLVGSSVVAFLQLYDLIIIENLIYIYLVTACLGLKLMLSKQEKENLSSEGNDEPQA